MQHVITKPTGWSGGSPRMSGHSVEQTHRCQLEGGGRKRSCALTSLAVDSRLRYVSNSLIPSTCCAQGSGTLDAGVTTRTGVVA